MIKNSLIDMDALLAIAIGCIIGVGLAFCLESSRTPEPQPITGRDCQLELDDDYTINIYCKGE